MRERCDYHYGDKLYQCMQVRRSDGAYIDVPYRPDSVLINLGVQMEHWTNKIYPATVQVYTA